MSGTVNVENLAMRVVLLEQLTANLIEAIAITQPEFVQQRIDDTYNAYVDAYNAAAKKYQRVLEAEKWRAEHGEGK